LDLTISHDVLASTIAVPSIKSYAFDAVCHINDVLLAPFDPETAATFHHAHNNAVLIAPYEQSTPRYEYGQSWRP
jgi:hypothetical protein